MCPTLPICFLWKCWAVSGLFNDDVLTYMVIYNGLYGLIIKHDKLLRRNKRSRLTSQYHIKICIEGRDKPWKPCQCIRCFQRDSNNMHPNY
jgi:hypothetical protein